MDKYVIRERQQKEGHEAAVVEKNSSCTLEASNLSSNSKSNTLEGVSSQEKENNLTLENNNELAPNQRSTEENILPSGKIDKTSSIFIKESCLTIVSKEEEESSNSKKTGKKSDIVASKTKTIAVQQKIHKWLGLKNGKGICKLCTEAVEKKLFSHADLVGRAKCAISAFVLDGFVGWKNVDRLRKHEHSEIHKKAFLALHNINKKTVIEQLSDGKRKEMANSRIAYKKIVETVNLFGQQGLALRHNDNDENSCFMKFLRLRARDIPELDWWLRKAGYKWLHHDYVNELLQMMSAEVLNKYLEEIKSAKYFSIIMDETADISRQEQVSISLRMSSTDFEVHEIFTGFYHTSTTKSEALLNILKDVLLRFNLDFSNLRGQCYDGAAAMSGKISGLQTRVKEIEPRALFVHCTAHSLNLVVQDALKNVEAVNNFIGIAKDLITYVRDSPKRLDTFKDVQNQLQSSEDSNVTLPNLSPFCPTRWCMRVRSLKTIIVNYEAILMFLEESKSEKTSDSGKAEGFLKLLEGFEFYYLLRLTVKVLERIEILNAELQKKDLSINESHQKVKLTLDCIIELRESGFDSLWEIATTDSKNLELEEPKLPRQRRAPKKFETANIHIFTDPKGYYRKIYFEIVDQIILSLNERFQSETIEFLNYCENFIIGNESDLTIIQTFYQNDLDVDKLLLHRNMLIDTVKARKIKLDNFKEAVVILKTEKALSELLSELSKFVRLILTIPASTCTAERSFSALRRLKNYLKSTMSQLRLNSIAILHIHSDVAEEIDLDKILDNFISKNHTRRSTFQLSK